MTLASYAAVADLSDDALRRLLAAGDPAEKVWAAWALGLRSSGSTDVVRAAASTSPEPGVRRQIVVILVGLGELDAVLVLAAADPASSVRATAGRYLVRLARALPKFWSPAVERLTDQAAEVRAAIVEEVAAEPPSEVKTAILGLVADPSWEVRRAVVEFAERQASNGAFPEQEARSRMATESDPDLRARWQLLWIGGHGASGFYSPAFAGANEAIVLQALELLAASKVPVTWADVAGAAEWIASSPGKTLLSLFPERLDEVPLAPLLEYLAAPGREGEVGHFQFLEVLTDRLSAASPNDLGMREREAIATLGWRARKLEKQFSSTEWLDEHDEGPSIHGEDSEDSWEQEERDWQTAVRELAALCERVTNLG